LIHNPVVSRPPFQTHKETRLKTTTIAVLAISPLAVAGNASAIDWNAICCEERYEYHNICGTFGGR